jgi:hypothetical protein
VACTGRHCGPTAYGVETMVSQQVCAHYLGVAKAEGPDLRESPFPSLPCTVNCAISLLGHLMFQAWAQADLLALVLECSTYT